MELFPDGNKGEQGVRVNFLKLTLTPFLTGMSQSVFASRFRLSLDTLKGWEQGKRKPDAAAANFLRMIKADPEYVQSTLAV